MKEDIKCIGCPYKNDQTKRVDGVNLDKEVLLVMHSPGTNENITGKPLSGVKGSSATEIIKKLLPSCKTLEDYAIVELVRCKPTNKTIDEVALAICCRYLEEDITKGQFKKIITFCESAYPIVNNILSRNNLSIEVVPCEYPKNTLTDEEKDKIKTALAF